MLNLYRRSRCWAFIIYLTGEFHDPRYPLEHYLLLLDRFNNLKTTVDLKFEITCDTVKGFIYFNTPILSSMMADRLGREVYLKPSRLLDVLYSYQYQERLDGFRPYHLSMPKMIRTLHNKHSH